MTGSPTRPFVPRKGSCSWNAAKHTQIPVLAFYYHDNSDPQAVSKSTHLCVLVDGEFFSLLECIDGAPRTTEQDEVMSWCGLPVCASGPLVRGFLEPETGFPMFDRFPRLSLASSLSFFPRYFFLKCVAAVPAAAGLSSWTSNILSMSLSVMGGVCVCVCVCVWERESV